MLTTHLLSRLWLRGHTACTFLYINSNIYQKFSKLLKCQIVQIILSFIFLLQPFPQISYLEIHVICSSYLFFKCLEVQTHQEDEHNHAAQSLWQSRTITNIVKQTQETFSRELELNLHYELSHLSISQSMAQMATGKCKQFSADHENESRSSCVQLL